MTVCCHHICSRYDSRVRGKCARSENYIENIFDYERGVAPPPPVIRPVQTARLSRTTWRGAKTIHAVGAERAEAGPCVVSIYYVHPYERNPTSKTSKIKIRDVKRSFLDTAIRYRLLKLRIVVQHCVHLPPECASSSKSKNDDNT